MDLVTRLSYLFGTEESVRHRRQLVLLREKILTSLSHEECSMICSGSMGEGVSYPPSDDDLMYIIERQSCLVYDSYDEAIQRHALHMVASEFSPGFCIVQNINESGLTPKSSKEFREILVQEISGSTLHGPCATKRLGMFEYDFAPCLSSPHWPAMANEWINRRRRYGSPPRELVESIVSNGCHLVPIGNPESPLCDLEWRVSFSLAERHLIHNFNHVQFIIYNLLKLILKQVINREAPDVLCSYFLKTVLFYAIENTSPEFWGNVRVEECYRKCLTLLYHFINEMNCPNYFLPGNNMMKRKVNTNNKVPLMRVLAELLTRGIAGSLYLCSDVSIAGVLSLGLSPMDIEFEADRNLLSGYHLVFTMLTCKHLTERNMDTSACVSGTLGEVLYPFVSAFRQVSRSCGSGIVNLIFRQVLTNVGVHCFRKSCYIPQGNKSRYQMLVHGQVSLIKGRRADVSSGRLQLATYMFMTGRFHHCLTTIKVVLSNVAVYVMSHQWNRLEEARYKDVICNNGHPLCYKVENSWALDIEFCERNIDFAPIPVRMLLVLNNRTISLSPLVYAYFLQGLCFYHIGDMGAMYISASLLQGTLRDLPRRCLAEIFISRFLLGYTRMLQQDYRSSCRCITAAYLMSEDLEKTYTKDSFKTAKTCSVFLACLLNRYFSSVVLTVPSSRQCFTSTSKHGMAFKINIKRD